MHCHKSRNCRQQARQAPVKKKKKKDLHIFDFLITKGKSIPDPGVNLSHISVWKKFKAALGCWGSHERWLMGQKESEKESGMKIPNCVLGL
jgi:hypothetical protein